MQAGKQDIRVQIGDSGRATWGAGPGDRPALLLGLFRQ